MARFSAVGNSQSLVKDTTQDREKVSYGFEADFQVESYLRHQGSTFVDRFDANSYLYITRAMDYFDMASEHGGSLSEAALHRKFGRSLQDREALTFGFDADFQIESYLRYQGMTFVDRFDANAYLYMTRAMDYFDLAVDYGGSLASAFKGTATRFCVMSFTSDWLFPTAESRDIVHALNAAAANVSFVEIETDKGHDSFLLDEPEMFRIIDGFLTAAGRLRGLE